MTWPPSPFVAALLVAGLLATGLALMGWRHREATGGPAFVVMATAGALWAFGDAAQFSASGLGSYLWWTNLSFLVGVTATNAAFVFVVQYTGKDHWVTRRTLALLAVEPMAATLLAWTTTSHGLIWKYTGELQTTPVSWVPVENGIGLHVHLLYSYTLMAALLWLLARFYLRSRGTYRWQTLLMFVGALAPIATHVVWLYGQNRYPGPVNPTPVTFALTSLLFSVGLRSFDLLELAPVGRHTVVEELQDAVLTVNSEGRIVDANPVARTLLAPSGDALVGEDADAVVPQYEQLQGPGGEAEDVAITVEGERRYFDVRQSPLSDAAEEVVGRVVLLRDVTERRRVEKRYQLLIENASDLITVLDEDGTIRYASPSTRRVLGYEPENTEGSNALEFIHPDDQEEIADQLATLADAPGGELEAEYRTRTADGEWRVIDSRGRNLLDDPVVEGIVVNSRDITERREREQRLERRNEQLEEFANVITHDLRNPLSVAHGYARLLEEEYDDERLGKVANAHERMEELLEDLLTLAREGRAVSEPEPVALAEAAHQAWAIVDTPNATLSVEDGRNLLADDTRLRQLLENLFANAAEHGSASPPSHAQEDAAEHGSASPDSHARQDTAEHGSASSRSQARENSGEGSSTDSRTQSGDAAGHGAKADVAPTASANGGDRAEVVSVRVGTTDDGFYVADDGPGIPESARERVFEAGESGDVEGIGLGLTIVRRIADAHGWTVGVTESDEGGARFEFSDVDWADDP